jgi:hypothetical protein
MMRVPYGYPALDILTPTPSDWFLPDAPSLTCRDSAMLVVDCGEVLNKRAYQ